MFSRSESLYDEEDQLRRLSEKLAAISNTRDERLLSEAKDLIIRLKTINRRWNIDGLDRFIKDKQRELFF